jgi:hypothetical protein
VIFWLFACITTKPASDPCDACGGACLEESAPEEGHTHTTDDVTYSSYPPMSGNHDPCWTTWGVHTDAVRTENWVHNLEHGGVVVVYDPTLAEADVTALTTWATGLPEGRVVLTPATQSFDGVVAAVAWEHRIILGCVDVDTLDTFFWANIGNAREDTTSNPSPTCGMTDTGDTGGAGGG